MAARLRPRHQEEVRTKIQASQLINRLTNHALGKVDMTATQVQAVRILLDKSLPNLAAVEHSGNDDSPVVHAFKWKE